VENFVDFSIVASAAGYQLAAEGVSAPELMQY
jgi:hypothetical protein